MHTDHPGQAQYDALRALWAQAFGDADSMISLFFDKAFSPQRCLCLEENGEISAALYWLDCQGAQGKIAYLYAVATAKKHRGKGLCRRLMEDTHEHLQVQGYRGAILVPGEPELFGMYGKMGYVPLACMDTVSCKAQGTVPVSKADASTFAAARRRLLPRGGVEQEMGLNYLSGYAELYTGADFTLAGVRQGPRFAAMELLGNAAAAPGILGALGLEEGTFRIPGKGPFAMYCPLSEDPAPGYFGLAFD